MSSFLDHLQFRTPLESTPPTLMTLLERSWPEGTVAQRERLLSEGLVRVDGVVQKKSDHCPEEDANVDVALHVVGAEPFGIPDVRELERGEQWVLVDKPVGMPGALDRQDPVHPVLFMADSLGLDRDSFTPVWEMPTTGGGPWLISLTQEGAKELETSCRQGQMMLTWLAIVPRLPLPRGQMVSEDGVAITYSVTQYKKGLCEVQLIPSYTPESASTTTNPVDLILEALAQIDSPVLGDRERGGYMTHGGVKLRLAVLLDEKHGLGHSWDAPKGWWPTDAVVPWEAEEDAPQDPSNQDEHDPQEHTEAPARRKKFGKPDPEIVRRGKEPKQPRGASHFPTLRVSPKTLEILDDQGHPWVLTDKQTGGRAHMKPGTVVQLVDPKGKRRGPWALVESPHGEIAARVWAQAWDVRAVTQMIPEIEMRVDRALANRAQQLEELAQTDLFRLVHGQADGLPGLLIDRVGPLIRATLTSPATRAFKRAVYTRLLAFDPKATLIEISHTEDVRARGDVLPRARLIQTSSLVDQTGRVIGAEDGLRYWCEPWEGIDTGFFADQRMNRRALVEVAQPGDRWLNLFGHTGAFSVALANEGAHVVNVDVSKRYLEWTAQNMELNGLDAGLNEGAAEDAREYVSRAKAKGQKFAGIILDPPTASQGIGGFWSIRKDFTKLLQDCFSVLEPGGVMLVCRNDRKGRGGLASLVEQAAKAVGWQVASTEDAPPAPDYPSLKGFPEGDPFEGVLVRGKG